MIEKKFEYLKRLMNNLDSQKMQESKLDSISLISQNLSRAKRARQIPDTPQKFLKLSQTRQSRQLSMLQIQPSTPLLGGTAPTTFLIKTKSLYDGSLSPSPRKSPPNFKKRSQTLYNKNKNKLLTLGRKLYEARNKDMDVKNSQLGLTEFLKTFMLKNTKNGDIEVGKVDVSGLELFGHSMQVVNGILKQYLSINISRNILHSPNITSIQHSSLLQQLILKNCGMGNQQLGHLFKILIDTPIKILVVSSTDVKDRNRLTKYDQLYEFVRKSKTIQTLEMANIQIHPTCRLFEKGNQSQSLKKLDLSKNKGVSGIYKKLTHLNLSWNGISNPQNLKCIDSELIRLDLTGNPIPSALFSDIFITSNFPVLQQLILNKITLSTETDWLQQFLQKSKSLKKLCAIDCNLTRSSFLNISYGSQSCKTLKQLNLSCNKFPSDIAAHFSVSVAKSWVSRLALQQCDIKDPTGAILVENFGQSQRIQAIDFRRNGLAGKTAEKLCHVLKKGGYNLFRVCLEQNFIKYIQSKEIQAYIDRNIFMAKNKVKEEFKKYEKMGKNYEENNQTIKKGILQAEKRVEMLKAQGEILEREMKEKLERTKKIQEMLVEEKLKRIIQEEERTLRIKNQIQEQIRALQNMNEKQQV